MVRKGVAGSSPAEGSPSNVPASGWFADVRSSLVCADANKCRAPAAVVGTGSIGVGWAAEIERRVSAHGDLERAVAGARHVQECVPE
jgi:hypothetical protein